MTLTIDAASCDLASGTHFDADYDADRLLSPSAARTGRSVKLLLPRTAANDLRFDSAPLFHAVQHTAQLTHDGAVLLAGTLRLLSTSRKGYAVELRGGVGQWARNAALGAFREIPLPFTGSLTPADIGAGWSDARPVKFLPVLRDSYERQNSSTDLQPVFRALSPDDYHPFLQLDALLRTLFSDAGYTVESRFMQTQFFRSLYLSGAYAARDTAAVEKRMGFRAVRLTTATATADAVGRVYATPYGAGNVVGNIVETATPLATDEEGVVRTDPYNNGNCFGLEDRKIVYRPASALSIGFEYRLRYTTDHRILTRERLAGFDSVNFGTGGTVAFRLPNRYADRRSSLMGRTSYRVIVFDGGTAAQYRLLYTLNGNPDTLWTDFTGRTAVVTTAASGTFTDPVLYVRSGSSSWALWHGDWALYDGHLGETGRTTVEFRMRTPAESVGASAPKYFNTIFFSGAEEGMQFTLHTQCSLRPVFSPASGYGAPVTTADVARHDIRQQVFVEAVQHLFNLRFFSDEQQKKVYVEPDAEFWDESSEADWRNRTDFTQPVVWEDAALEVHDSRTYGYLAGDGATTRLMGGEELPFGSWHIRTDSCACIEGSEKRTSPLFSPTLNAAGVSADAPSALLMQVGDRDDASLDGVNFSPRIVRYCGLRPLPAGERWDDSPERTSYPFAAFHFAGDGAHEGFTLCFDDRDGQQGLHRFYDRAECIGAARRHVSVTLRIDAHEFESLFTPGTGAPDLRWVFRISTDQGDVRATLRRIGEYDPAKSAARCTFTLLPHD